MGLCAILLLGLLVCCSAYDYYQQYYYPQVYLTGSYGGFQHQGYGRKNDRDDDDKDDKVSMLSCVRQFDADPATATTFESLSANIMERKEDLDRKSNRHGGYGYGGSLFSGYGHQGYGDDDKDKKGPGLKGEFVLESQTAQTVSLLLMEKGFAGSGLDATMACVADEFGLGLPKDSKKKSRKSSHFGYGYGYSSGGYDEDESENYGQNKFNPVGFLAEVTLVADVRRFINLNPIKGYDSIKDLAGRFLVMCNNVEVNNHRVRCADGAIIACCALGLDHQLRSLP